MGEHRVVARPWLAAALLAVLTVFVFATLGGTGPESAVLRFHMALNGRDNAEIQQRLSVVTVQSLQDADEARQVLAVAKMAADAGRGRKLQVIDRQIRGERALVIVQYDAPKRTKRVRFWVAVQGRDGHWRVDAWQTWVSNRRLLRF